MYGERFAILNQVTVCLGEDELPVAKRAFNVQGKDSSFAVGRAGWG